ncbi:hypothetical protein [Extibacter muris]|uniref:hypothetical protein n=2 Tax=Extibacter muris TaxID=1796622 RepID=UPI001D063D22|nr:hypothetical protein [Extibacter muris]MCB6203468.1 hypothetical protein [Extibacter muris]
MHMVRSMSKGELIRHGCLWAGNVQEAFETYESVIISADSREKMTAYFGRILEANEDIAYADFYYPVLKEAQKQKFLSGLDSRQMAVLRKMETVSRQVYYRADWEIMEFLLEITVAGWLFSTFYFAHKKAMIWGNYNMEFPVFCEEKATLACYAELAKECGLECHE